MNLALRSSPHAAADGMVPPAAASLALAASADRQWFPLSDLYKTFDRGDDNANRSAAQRWYDKLTSPQRGKQGGRLTVRGDARLPNGLSVLAHLTVGPAKTLGGFKVPPGSETWSTHDRQRFLDTHALLAGWESFRNESVVSASSRLTDEQLAARFAAAPALKFPLMQTNLPDETVAQWAAQRRLRLSPRTLREYARRLDPSAVDRDGNSVFDGNVDRRGKDKGKAATGQVAFEKCGTGQCPVDLDTAENSATESTARTPESHTTLIPNAIVAGDGEIVDAAWDLFKFFYLHPNKRSITTCWELVDQQAHVENWQWPSKRSIQMRVAKELPDSIADMWRMGEKGWDRKHGPRLLRDFESIQPLEVWIGDEHTFDVLVLANGKPDRPILTAWIDQRSRLLVGWVIRTAGNTDTILAAFRVAAKAYGVPRKVVIDNGADYASRALVNGCSKRRYDESFLVGVFPRINVAVQFCLPYTPQSKLIERFFETVCEKFSKRHQSYIGNKPDNRPENFYRELRAKKIEPPTLEEFSEAFREWVEQEYNRTAHSGDGMYGRSPLEVSQTNPISRNTTVTSRELDVLLMRRVSCTVTRLGVRVNDGDYGQYDVALKKLIGQKVEVAIDDSDLQYVLVFDSRGDFVARVECDRNACLTAEDVREGMKRKRRTAKAIKQFGPALADRYKSAGDFARELGAARAERIAEQEVIATGTDNRPLKLITGGAGFQPADPTAIVAAAKQLGSRTAPSRSAPADDVSFSSADFTDDPVVPEATDEFDLVDADDPSPSQSSDGEDWLLDIDQEESRA